MNKVSCQVTVGVDVAGIDVSSTRMKCSLPCLMVVFVDLSFVLVSLLHIRSSKFFKEKFATDYSIVQTFEIVITDEKTETLKAREKNKKRTTNSFSYFLNLSKFLKFLQLRRQSPRQKSTNSAKF